MTALTEQNWELRLKTVQTFLLTGSLRRTSELVGVPYPTLCDWKNQEWWHDFSAEIRTEAGAKTSKTINKLIDTSLEIVQERLENGDWVFDQKTGKAVRKPVSVRDAADIAGRLLQRQLKLDEMENSKNYQQQVPVGELLKTLALEFKKYNKIEVVDVEDAKEIRKPTNLELWLERKKQNALHDQRQEGLQEGSGEIYVEAGSSEETSGAEQSPSNDGESWKSS